MRYLIFLLIIVSLAFNTSCGSGKNPKDDQSVVADSLPSDISALTKLIQDHPDNASLYNHRAELYLEKKKPLDALTDINKAIALDAKNPKYFRTLSDVYFSMGKSQQCRDALNKALEIEPDDTASFLKLAELEYYFKAYDKTFDYLNKALAIDSKNAKAFFIKGMAYEELGDTAKSVKNFQLAVENDQEYYHAYMQLGLLFSVKHNPLAVDYFNNALNCNPKSTETYYALGMYYQENAQYNKAIETYTTLLKIDPKYKYAYYNLGYIHLVYLQVYDVAAKHFSDAIKIDPNYAEAWYNLGYCYELMGDVINAKSDYQKAITIRPNYQRAIDGLNRIDKIINK